MPDEPVETAGGQPAGGQPADGAIVRRRLVISGRVQGVYFRASLREQAVRLGVAGSARNLTDGSVGAVLEGRSPAVAAVVAWCRQGPPRAHVTAVTVTEEDVQGLSGFAVG